MLCDVSLTGEGAVESTYENPGGSEERQVGEDVKETRPALNGWFWKHGERPMGIYCNSPYFDAFFVIFYDKYLNSILWGGAQGYFLEKKKKRQLALTVSIFY